MGKPLIDLLNNAEERLNYHAGFIRQMTVYDTSIQLFLKGKVDVTYDIIVATFSVYYYLLELTSSLEKEIAEMDSDNTTEVYKKYHVYLEEKEKFMLSFLSILSDNGMLFIDEPTYKLLRHGFNLLIGEKGRFSEFLTSKTNGRKVKISKLKPVGTGMEEDGYMLMKDLPGTDSRPFVVYPVYIFEVKKD